MDLQIYSTRFHAVYSQCQHQLYIRPNCSVVDDWELIHKKKKKFYYRLYLKLIKIKFERLKVASFRLKFRWILPDNLNSRKSKLSVYKLHSELYEFEPKLDNISSHLDSCFNKIEFFNTCKIRRFRGYSIYEEKVFDCKVSSKKKTILDVFQVYKKIKTQIRVIYGLNQSNTVESN